VFPALAEFMVSAPDLLPALTCTATLKGKIFLTMNPVTTTDDVTQH
jgi:hypothetical protein